MARLCFLLSTNTETWPPHAKFQDGALAGQAGEVPNEKAKRDHHKQRLSQDK